MASIITLAGQVGTAPACLALGVSRASFYRKLAPLHGPAPARRRPARALATEERQAVLDHLYSPRFQNQAPIAVCATLLDEGLYHCSARTMYRLLEQANQTKERRNQLTHPAYAKPELLASEPNRLWSWDITKLLGPAK